MSYDRRTGKPIAVSVIKLPPGTVGFEILSEERVTGTVAAEAKPVKNRNVSSLLHIPTLFLRHMWMLKMLWSL